ncbi:YoaK family protein [Streptomyces sp. NPDC052042]|uniref:YoaK family protein n=1 Tax=Streptomyces sp. NPDC052042 TaxID=3365683 RepID=UPI0037CFF2F8
MPTLSSPARRDPRTAWALLLLSAASGAADAFAFVCLGQVFAGVMTGNLVLLGASAVGIGEHGMALRVVTALVAYGSGVACGAWLSARLRWSVPMTLLVEAGLLGAAAVLWGVGPAPSGGDRPALLVLGAAAMGVQGSTLATPTNYFTGTLTSLVGRAASRSRRREDGWAAARLAAVVAGAAVTALAVRFRPETAATVMVVPVVGALLVEAVPGRRSSG